MRVELEVQRRVQEATQSEEIALRIQQKLVVRHTTGIRGLWEKETMERSIT